MTTSASIVKVAVRHYTSEALPQTDEHVMIRLNLRPDSAWGKAHYYGTTSRTSCDHTLAPGPRDIAFQGNRRLAHRARFRRIRILSTIAFDDQGELRPLPLDRKSTRLNSSHIQKSRMPSSA